MVVALATVPAPIPVTVPRPGVPAEPIGRVIVIVLIVAVVAVVNE